MFAAPALFIVIGRGIMWGYDYFKKYSKNGAIAVITVLLLIGIFSQITQADSLLNQRKNDQAGIKSAAEFIKQNSDVGEWVLSNNIHAEMTYWADRPTRGFGKDEEDTLKVIEELKPKFLTVTGYFPSLEWTYSFPAENSDRFEPVAVFDALGKPLVSQEQQPIIVIYRIKY